MLSGGDHFQVQNETDEEHAAKQRQAYVDALVRERRGYSINKNKEGVAAVDAELKRLGLAVKPATERAVTEPPETRA